MSNVGVSVAPLTGPLGKTEDGIVIGANVEVVEPTAHIGEALELFGSYDRLVYEACRSTGLAGTHQAYPEGSKVKPPFFVYSLDSGGEQYADDDNWYSMPRYRVELIERQADPVVETALLMALKRAFGPVCVYEDWSESEHARIVSYYFTVTKEGN